MAKEHPDTQDKCFIIELTKKETADLIGLLTAQLADVPLVNNQS